MIDYETELENRGFDVIPTGKNYIMTTCPFHNDGNPSFSVSTKTGSYRCFACEERGSFVELIAYLDDITIKEALYSFKETEKIDGIFSLVVDSLEEDKDTLKYFNIKSFNKIFPSVIDTPGEEYLNNRGIRGAIIKKFDIRWGDAPGKWQDRVILPIYTDKGRLLAYTGRTIHGHVHPKTRKNRSPARALYGLNVLARKSKRLQYVIIVEGECSVVYMQMLGLPAVATMGVAPLSPLRIALLRKYANSVVLAFDGDRAGQLATNKAVKLLDGFLPVSIARLPENKDPNDLSEEAVKEIFGEYNV